ncbi:hypothetical protein B0H16DRAFT_1711196 [Mycena metata]|uniref:Uncharacterized protein n=1 Tax=Mycena metata TaxID=1033252 RepID=A0AAD7NYC5_9AGAR|nr:hypothetical protein B0H16DRAFT_1711196 [Mycena metata]
MPAFEFTPMREELLNQWTAAFRELVETSMPMENFWTCLFADYWGTFSWRRPFDEDPPNGRDVPEAEELSAEEHRARGRIIAKTNRRIKAYFSYHYHRTNMQLLQS